MWLLKQIWDDLDVGIVDAAGSVCDNVYRMFANVLLLLLCIAIAVGAFALPFIHKWSCGWECLPLTMLFVLCRLALAPLSLWLVATQIRSLHKAFGSIRRQIAEEKAGKVRRSPPAAVDTFNAWHEIPFPEWEEEGSSASLSVRGPSYPASGNVAGSNRPTRRSRLPIPPRRRRGQASKRFRAAGQMRQSPCFH